MALRDKLRDRCQPMLEPGEQVQQTFLAQTGGTPWLLFVSWLATFFFKYRIVCVTDRGIVVFNAGRWKPAAPKEVISRQPRNIAFGPLSGLWGKTEVTGEKLYVHKRFHKDVEAADAAVTGIGYGYAGAPQAAVGTVAAAPAAGAATTPAGWYADPNHPGTVRWYDGNQWTDHVQPAGQT